MLQKVRNNRQTRESFAIGLEEDLEEIKKKVESEQKRNTCISESDEIRDVGIEDFAINLEEVNEAERRKVIEKINRLYKIIEGGKEGGREE